MMRILAGLALMPIAMALAGCGDEAKKAQGAGTAQGEVLPGSVSDAMVPVDQLKSQPPLAPKSEGADKKDITPGGKTKSASDTPPAAAPDEAPASADEVPVE
jgi:hypothetical protein